MLFSCYANRSALGESALVFGLAVPSLLFSFPAPDLTCPILRGARAAPSWLHSSGRLPLLPSHRFRRRLTIWPVPLQLLRNAFVAAMGE